MLDEKLVSILCCTFHLEPAMITPGLSAKDVAAWDSVGHLTLVLEVENAFQIRFPTEIIPSLTSVERLQEAVEQHRGG